MLQLVAFLLECKDLELAALSQPVRLLEDLRLALGLLPKSSRNKAIILRVANEECEFALVVMQKFRLWLVLFLLVQTNCYIVSIPSERDKRRKLVITLKSNK